MLNLTAALLLLCDWESENPVGTILAYLLRHQNEDGSWQTPPTGCRCYFPRPLDARIPVVPDPDTIRRFHLLTPTLGCDSAADRESAQKALYGLGPPAIPLLQDASTHLDPEVRWRCRETLEQHWKTDSSVRDLFRQAAAHDTLDFGLKATSLALLNFLGAGYSQLSRDQWSDTVNLGSTYHSGHRIKKALRWLLDQQKGDGSFPSPHFLTQAMAALALSEYYGMTVANDLREPAQRAVNFIQTLKSSDPDVLLWKKLVHFSGDLAGFPLPPSDPKLLLSAFENATSIPHLSRNILVSSLLKVPCEGAKARFLGLDQEDRAPEERFVTALAVCRTWKPATAERCAWQVSILSGWRKLQVTAKECRQGTWTDAPGGYEERMMSTLFTGLTLEHAYCYANALLALP